MEIQDEFLPGISANGHFALDFSGPQFLLQLFRSFYYDFNCSKRALLLIWHLKLGIQADGIFSLKESNLENSVKKIKT